MVPIRDLLNNCGKFGDRIALSINGRDYSYRELEQSIFKYAALLTTMLKAGDRLALLCSNSIEFVSISLAAEATGVIRVPLNIKSTASEIAILLDDCSPSLVVCEEQTKHLLDDRPSIRTALASELTQGSRGEFVSVTAEADHRCSITYTSGSTGKPKGVVLTHANWHYVFANMLVDRDIQASDTLAFIGPLTHASWSYLYAGLLKGAKSVVFAAGDVDALLTYADRNDVNIVTCVPTTLSRIATLIGDQHRLRDTLKWIGVGGAPTSPALLERVLKVFGRRVVLNFGQTEAMMTCAFYDFTREVERKDEAGFIGRPYTFSQIIIAGADGQKRPLGEVGEICVRGPHTMLEYWNQPDVTSSTYRDGFILTGDLGVEDEPGLYRIVGRAKDVIISGGFNIYPLEVESAVAAIDDVDEVAVVGVPCEEWGEKVVCLFSTSSGEQLNAAELKAKLKPQIGIKTPKVFHQLPSLPKAATGKIDKKALKNWLETNG